MTWVVLATIGGLTYLLRASMFVVLGSRSLPARLETPMSLVAPAAIGGLLATMLMTSSGRFSSAPMAELVAVAAGFLVVRRTRNVLHAMVVGLPIVWLLASFGA